MMRNSFFVCSLIISLLLFNNTHVFAQEESPWMPVIGFQNEVVIQKKVIKKKFNLEIICQIGLSPLGKKLQSGSSSYFDYMGYFHYKFLDSVKNQKEVIAHLTPYKSFKKSHWRELWERSCGQIPWKELQNVFEGKK